MASLITEAHMGGSEIGSTISSTRSLPLPNSFNAFNVGETNMSGISMLGHVFSRWTCSATIYSSSSMESGMRSKFQGSTQRCRSMPAGKVQPSHIHILQDKDNNQNFIRLLKFGPTFENCRTSGQAWKRFAIYGHDYSKTSFAAQIPASKYARREERTMHFLRTLNLYVIVFLEQGQR